MTENGKKEILEKRDTLRVAKFSRRQFLQRAGMAAGGAAIASISLASACKSAGAATATSTTTTTSGNTTGATISTVPASSSTIPASSTTATISTIPTLTSTTATTSATTTSITIYNYVPPLALPPLLTVTDTTCTVANDGRLYSADHIWVKSLVVKIAVMGITKTMEEIIYEPFKIKLPKVGDTLVSGEAFGEIEGYKMNADMLSPVSGTVIQVNDFLLTLMNQGTVLEPVINNTYNAGWMVVVQMSNLDELKALMTAQSYLNLVAKK